MIRSAEDVIAIAKSRGFKIVVDPGPPPMPRLSFRVAPEHAEKQRSEATDSLMTALKVWRLEIIQAVLEGKA